MAFTSGTCRTVLYHKHGFLYPIGNTPAHAVLPAGYKPAAACKVLLLGCGDVRNALVTAAALSSAGATSAEIHLNDISDVILARAVLLLAVADSIAPASKDDVEFLWCLWFNAQLSKDHRQRLNDILQQAVAAQLPTCVELAQGDTAAMEGQGQLLNRLQIIWQSWLQCRKPPQELARERKAFMLASLNRRQQSQGCSRHDWQEAAELASFQGAVDELLVDSRTLPTATLQLLSEELKVYFLHGSILGDGTACQGGAVNPTFLDAQGKWRVHDSSCPFKCFPPASQQQLSRSSGGGGSNSQLGSKDKSSRNPKPGILTRIAQASLAEMIANYQKAARAPTNASLSSSSSSSSSVHFILHGGDGLELCGAGSSLGDDTRFHAIDVSNVGDHAGLLNTLVAAAPRLFKHPSSRLYAYSMTWNSSRATSLPEYLSMALGGSPSLLPTLLGLRLVTETRFGKLEPYTLYDRVATRSSNTRQLEFVPAQASAAAAFGSSVSGSCIGDTAVNGGCEGVGFAAPTISMPLRPGGCGLSEALLNLEKLCCAGFAGYMQHDRYAVYTRFVCTCVRLIH